MRVAAAWGGVGRYVPGWRDCVARVQVPGYRHTRYSSTGQYRATGYKTVILRISCRLSYPILGLRYTYRTPIDCKKEIPTQAGFLIWERVRCTLNSV